MNRAHFPEVVVGFGTKTSTPCEVLAKAIELGYNFFDFKDTNESLKCLRSLKFSRENVTIASKLYAETCPENHAPDRVLKACDESLEICGLAYWDIYYIHTFHSFGGHSVLATYEKLVELKELGRTKFIGISNVTLDQLEVVCTQMSKPDFVQIEIHPYLVEEDLVRFCKRMGIHVVAHSPFGSSIRRKIQQEPLLQALALKYGRSVAQVLLQWHRSRGVIPIPSGKDPQHILENIGNAFLLSSDDAASITSLNKNIRVFVKPNHDEAVGRLCNPLPQFRESPSTVCDNHIVTNIVNDLLSKGFHATCASVDQELEWVLKRAASILSEQLPSKNHFGREYEVQHEAPSLSELGREFCALPLIKKLVREYLRRDDIVEKVFFKTSCSSLNLRPVGAGLFHRDLQGQKNLKIVIYLCDVTAANGALKVVAPEGGSDHLTWYFDGTNARATHKDVAERFSDSAVHTIAGPKFTCVFLEGSALHSGGYVRSGSRQAIYAEFYPRQQKLSEVVLVDGTSTRGGK